MPSDPREVAPPPAAVRLLYIIGVSRSGSTILDAVLGSQPGITATGELYQLAKDDHGERRICACGEPPESCSFWGPVLAEWQRVLGPGGTSDYLKSQSRFERFRQLPRIAAARLRRSKTFDRYARCTFELLRLVNAKVGGGYIADSSKHPPRALALMMIEGIEVSLIHILRDPRAVVWSKLEFDPMGGPQWLLNPVGTTLRTVVEWLLINTTTELIRRVYPQVGYVRIRYEDFADDPVRELGRLGDTIAMDLSVIAGRAAAGEAFGFGHIMAGNRARHRGSRPLMKDTDWQRNGPAWIRHLVWFLTGLLARHYGYRR